MGRNQPGFANWRSLWQEEEEANAGSTVETEGWSNISQVRQLSSIELLLIFLAYILCEYGI